MLTPSCPSLQRVSRIYRLFFCKQLRNTHYTIGICHYSYSQDCYGHDIPFFYYRTYSPSNNSRDLQCLRTPSCNAIKALSVLNGEPGGYMACNPLSKVGLAILSLNNFEKFLERSLPTKRFGS